MASESSSPRVGQPPRAPISLEGERRKAMKLVYRMERECEQFRERWLLLDNDDNTDDWLEFVNLAKSRHGGAFGHYRDFEKALNRIKQEGGFLGSRVSVISQLQKVCERAKAFDELFELSFHRIEDALNHYMAKYCLSFFAELDDMDVDCVREYDNSITEWQLEIRACLQEAEGAMETIHEFLDLGFTEYISSYSQVIRAMHASLDALIATCDPFRSWISADEGYLKRIRIELACLEGQKNRNAEVLRKHSFKVHEDKAKGLRTSFNNKKLNQEVQGTVSNRKFCRKREFSFVDKIEIAENILEERRLELEEAQSRLHARPLHSLVREPSDGTKERTARLQQEVGRLEGRLRGMKRGKRDLKETRYNLQKQYHNLKGTYETNLKKAARESERSREHVENVRWRADHVRTLDRKIHALKRIIYVKSHPATVKKIFFEGYLPGEKIDYRDTLREAIDVAAAGVGRDWDKMYQQLPFNPPRNPYMRNQDLELLDMDFKSVHPPSEQMALRSLDKWKSLSKVTSVNALVRTLKSIKKVDVAKQIEKKVLTVVN
ncbi:hypothetical protein MAR_008009 [Mya arenaria]|uniref:Death domain-containing protein n=1 Tax=Mya arenaria TaxID=6604 RepID=A0ABY7E2R5_MYAAR|nr:uncharacterized protein LOC128229953 isoform X2 [Mya arenaria]WAR01451.1 hypothetical protein MAR_008009 [Mya arenaria]